MHNKRLGRDDLIKIEVSNSLRAGPSSIKANQPFSGLVHLLLHPGDSILAVMSLVADVVIVDHPVDVIARLVAARIRPHAATVEITLHVRTTAANVTTIGVTVIVPEVLTIGIVK